MEALVTFAEECVCFSESTRRDHKIRSDSSDDISKVLIQRSDERMNFSMSAVEALPTRIQMTFGGAPFTNDRLRKSSSLEIMAKPCACACSQIAWSDAPASPIEVTWELPGNSLANARTNRGLKFSSNKSFKTPQEAC
jgi:hypothetical protein